jgi:hypothetical protein
MLGELPLSNWKTKDPYLYSEPGSGVGIKYATTPGRLIPLTFCLMYVVLLENHLALIDLYPNKAAFVQVELQHKCPKNHTVAVTPHLTATAFQRPVLAGQVDLIG